MNIKARWQQFDRRQQTTLLVGAVAIALYLLWFAVVSPLQQLVDKQQLRNQSAVESLGSVRQLAAECQVLKKQGDKQRAGSANLSQLVDRSVRKNRLKMSGFQPGSDGSVSLRFEQAPFENLMQWLYELDANHGVTVDELAIRPLQTAGAISATVRLKQGG